MFVQCDFGGDPPGYLVVITVEEGRRYRPTPEAAVRPSWIVERIEIWVSGDFGQRLAAARRERGIETARAAAAIGLSGFEYACLERSLTMPTREDARRLEELLGVTNEGGILRSSSEIHVSTREEVVGAVAAVAVGYFLATDKQRPPRRFFCAGDRCVGLSWPPSVMTHPIQCLSPQWIDTWPASTSVDGPLPVEVCLLCDSGWLVRPGCPMCDHPGAMILGTVPGGPSVPLGGVDDLFAAGWRELAEGAGRSIACPACGMNEEIAAGCCWRGLICPKCQGQGVV